MPRMRRGSLFGELARRHVFRVALAYGAVAWMVLQVASIVFPAFHLPEWTMTLLIILTAFGFPLALVLAWAYDITPQGVRRTDAEEQHGGGEVAVLRAPTPPAVPAERPAPERRTVAALPFVNMSENPENEYFSDGITEEIITRLSQIRDLRVISRTSVMRYKNASVSLREIADELGVANILEGSVRKSGTRVRISAQLIEAATDQNLWAHSYDHDLVDVFAVQADVATSIARALQATITASERSRIEKRPTWDLKAYELYLRAGHFNERVTPRDLRTAILLYEEAIQRDPEFALAYAGMAGVYLNMPYFASVEPKQVFDPARAAVERALELDPDLAEARSADAAIRLHYEWDWEGGERALAQEHALAPSSPMPAFWRAANALLRERFEEGLAHLDTALELDPFSPLIRVHQAAFLCYAGLPEQALPIARDVAERDPGFGFAHYAQGLALRIMGRYDEAITSFLRAAELYREDGLPYGSLALTYAAAGRAEEAERILADLQARAEQGWVDPMPLALAAFAVGRVELGLDYLERGEQVRSFQMLWIRPATHVTDYGGLRRHPRFQALLRRVWPDDFR
jgi:adenylate cyclase